MAIVERQYLRPQDLQTKNIFELTRTEETEKSSVVVTTDIEGPIFLGDFIAEAMEEYLVPQGVVIQANPSYGSLIYSEGWNWFTRETEPTRRGNGFKPNDRSQFSLSQEGTDTIFTLPMLIAAGATYQDLERLTLQSKETPGARVLVDRLRREDVIVIGITTAPVEPYRALFTERGINTNNIIGSPFPIEETRQLLQESGQHQTEVAITQEFLEEAYRIIDRHSRISVDDGTVTRHFSREGSEFLQTRIAKYISQDLGVSYDFSQRKKRGPAATQMGQVIEANNMMGSRAKAATSQLISRKLLLSDGALVAMGDGANDAVMLQRAPISIGLNGADAARAAKIAVVTDNVTNLLPIFWEIANGQRDIDSIIRTVRNQVDSSTLITKGGPDLPEFVAKAANGMKRQLRGVNITY